MSWLILLTVERWLCLCCAVRFCMHSASPASRTLSHRLEPTDLGRPILEHRTSPDKADSSYVMFLEKARRVYWCYAVVLISLLDGVAQVRSNAQRPSGSHWCWLVLRAAVFVLNFICFERCQERSSRLGNKNQRIVDREQNENATTQILAPMLIL